MDLGEYAGAVTEMNKEKLSDRLTKDENYTFPMYRIIEEIEALESENDKLKLENDTGHRLYYTAMTEFNKLNDENQKLKDNVKWDGDVIELFKIQKDKLLKKNDDLQSRLTEASKLVEKWRMKTDKWGVLIADCADDLEKALRGEP